MKLPPEFWSTVIPITWFCTPVIAYLLAYLFGPIFFIVTIVLWGLSGIALMIAIEIYVQKRCPNE